MKIKRWLYAALGLVVLSFTQCKEKEKKEKFTYERTKTEVKKEAVQIKVPIDLDNKGIGPVKEISFDETINKDLAAQGEVLYMERCTACHLRDKRMVGPALKGVYEIRSPEWVMNMIMNPIEMVKYDTIAKALREDYNGAIMTDLKLTKEETRAIAEYLRTL